MILNSTDIKAISINRTELQQILINLMVNAIHAMPDGGDLTVGALDAERGGKAGVLVFVKDTGVGMAPELLTRIFDPFFTTKQGEGTGLGLSITRKLVERYNGEIDADSTPGKGTEFRIWFPASEIG